MLRFINGWVPYWQHDVALSAIENNKNAFNDVLLFGWSCKADLSVLSQWYDPVPVARLKALGLPYWTTFTSAMTGPAAADLFDSNEKSQKMIDRMVATATSIGATGIDVDFESINFNHSGDSLPRTQSGYPRFLAQLKASAGSLKVSATIPARIADDDPDWKTYDFKKIGESVDLVRVMAYDHHTGSDSMGPVAPMDWYVKVLSYSKTRVPPSRLQMGVPAYGYRWPDGKTIFSKDATSLASANGTSVAYDATAKEGTFSYGNSTVWVATPKSMADRVKLCKVAGINGVAIWSIGDEDPASWPAMRLQLVEDKPVVNLKRVIAAAKRDPALFFNRKTYPRDVLVLQRALYQEGLLVRKFVNGSYNKKTVIAYSEWQKRLGYTGSDADGIPGLRSLKTLGSKYNFIVV